MFGRLKGSHPHPTEVRGTDGRGKSGFSMRSPLKRVWKICYWLFLEPWWTRIYNVLCNHWGAWVSAIIYNQFHPYLNTWIYRQLQSLLEYRTGRSNWDERKIAITWFTLKWLRTSMFNTSWNIPPVKVQLLALNNQNLNLNIYHFYKYSCSTYTWIIYA